MILKEEMETKQWVRKGTNGEGKHEENKKDSKPKQEMNPNALPFVPPAEKMSESVEIDTQNCFFCIACDLKFLQPREILEHMLNEHSLVIGEVEKIANLQEYVYLLSILLFFFLKYFFHGFGLELFPSLNIEVICKFGMKNRKECLWRNIVPLSTRD